MSAGRLQIRELLAGPPGSVHFVGIGGAGMAGLAFLLSRRGWRVSGCDAAGRSPRMDWLRKAGLDVRAQHDAAHAANADWMVRTAAVPEEHPEIRAARARQLPVFTRGQTLAAWLDGFESLAVCGTHGKTTTAAMATHILRAAGLDPSHCIGGESATLDPAGAGRGALLVVEADESDGTLSEYAPDVMVLTNVEFDHADHFADLAAVRACFEASARRARRGLVYNADDPGARALGRGLPRAVSFGIAPEAEWRAAAIEEHAEGLAFDLWRGAGRLGAVRLPAPGRHNVSNALAACAASSFFGAGFEAMRAAWKRFRP